VFSLRRYCRAPSTLPALRRFAPRPTRRSCRSSVRKIARCPPSRRCYR